LFFIIFVRSKDETTLNNIMINGNAASAQPFEVLDHAKVLEVVSTDAPPTEVLIAD
jgi:hypothetical protein